jgi:hypothetical protein
MSMGPGRRSVAIAFPTAYMNTPASMFGHTLLVVRSRKDMDSEARFWASVASSEPFRPHPDLHPGAA